MCEQALTQMYKTCCQKIKNLLSKGSSFQTFSARGLQVTDLKSCR